MGLLSRGFRGRRRPDIPTDRIPPGQYVTDDLPILTAGPTPRLPAEEKWRFTVTDVAGAETAWTWEEFNALPREKITVDIHCVTKWSKLDTTWEGVSVDTLLADVADRGTHALFRSYGNYSTNLPIEDVTGGKAWVALRYDREPLPVEHGGPARLLVPHLYFWKSAKWVRGMVLSNADLSGFWETLGYHNYGDPWLEQRYAGD
jgi:DMSO/TMAO reductase YedYZ molybdopterin-dependent catalytic subunit